MKVIKRNTTKENFDISKILKVLTNANDGLDEKIPQEKIKEIALLVSDRLEGKNEVSYKEIKETIQEVLIENNLVKLAESYIIACHKKENLRHRQKLNQDILDIMENTNEEVGTENANKDAKILSTQRDLMSGEVSKDLVFNYLEQHDPEILEAHKSKKIHIHDTDYIAMRSSNCCLVNLKDMFENGTVINGVKIDTPKSLKTATTLATQISQAVSSSQFGLSL